MSDPGVSLPQAIESLVRRTAAQVRWRRAEHHALRWAFYGAVVAAALLAAKGPLGPAALPAAVGAVLLGLGAGAVRGLARPVERADVARLADRAWGLEDRIATALEWATRPDRTPLVDALVADAVARVQRVEPRQVVRRVVPRQARWLPVPLLAALGLALAPAVPLPRVTLPSLSAMAERDEEPERRAGGTLERDRPVVPREPARLRALEERDFVPRAATGGAAMAGDLGAVFKDTALASQRPDFNSFLKQADDRLKMLGQADRLPDLQSDFTSSQYKVMYRRSRELRGGMQSGQMTPQKMRELLEEMERLGRKGGNWSSEIGEGMEALEAGQQDKAMEAMEKALNKLRAMEEAQRGGKGLRGGREPGRGSMARGERGAGGEGGLDDQDLGEGEGSLPGRGKSAAPKGEPSQRLRASPYDAGVEGESRRGRKEGYDTNMTGRAGAMGSRLAYLGVIGQYRKAMEDEIAREQVPRDLHAQIKGYFQALDER